MVSFSFFCSFGDNSIFVQILSGPETSLHISFVFFRSLIRSFLPFFSFSFFFLPFFDWEFPFLPFFLLSRVRCMVSQDFGSMLVEWLDMIHVRVWFGSRIKKGCLTLFPWHKCKNDDLEILCKTGHACTYANTQVSNFYGHVMLRLRIHFLYFKSTQCFQNMSFYQFVHSSESISGVRGNFHSIHPSGLYTFF